jgi:hypothetical protein
MKLTLPTTLKARAANPRQDARLKNAVIDKRKRIVKRPILDETFEPVALGPGLGLYVRDNTDIIAITGNTLTTNPVGIAKKLRYSVQPSKSSISTTISPSVTVETRTLFGSLLGSWLGDPPADEVSTVRLSLSTNPTGASLVGTVTTQVVGNVATFSNLRITRSGEGFKLKATAFNIKSVVSDAFDIPTRLIFTVQPSDTALNSTMAPIEVTAKDTAGNTDAQYTGTVILDTYSGGSGQTPLLTAVNAVAGVASFNTLQFTSTGTFRLRAKGLKVATAYPPAQVSSSSFFIGTATHTLTSAFIDADGTVYGFSDGIGGSISPTTLLGEPIVYCFSQNTISASLAPVQTQFGLGTGGHPQDFFTSITINGTTLLTASADDFTGGIWKWLNTAPISGAGTYQVNIV